MNILITGTAGFIGYHMAQRLFPENARIIGLDIINNYYDPTLKYARLAQCGIAQEDIAYNKLVQSSKHPNYQFIQLDLCDKENLTALFKEQQFDYVIALAAQAGVRYSIDSPDQYISSNVTGFLNILECCRHFPVKHLIYASTSSVYGLNTAMPFDPSHSANHPISLYSATKKANEMMAHSYSHLFGVPSTGLRFFTVYGTWGRPDMALFKFAKATLAGEPIDVYNEGNMVRDFTYVSDIVENIFRLLPHPPQPNTEWDSAQPDPATSSAPYRILNIGNSAPVQLMEYINALEAALGIEVKKNLMSMQPGDVPATFADVSSLEAITHFRPSTPVKEGVRRFIEWYKEYYGVEEAVGS